MSRMSPPASAIACAILATIPRAFLPVVVTTARLLTPPFPPFPPLPLAGEGGVRGDLATGAVSPSAAATSAATMPARSARRPALAATACVTRATSARTWASSRSASFTGQLHAIDHRHHGGVDRHVRLGVRRQRLRNGDARRVSEGHDHVVA